MVFFGQSLTGLWTGILRNDSNSVRKDQLFEIALTEYRGKVYGYSRSEFIVDDTLYYIVKRVKGTIEGDVCEVTDDEIIAFNFRGKLDKGIKVTSSFRRNKNDSAWYLAGTWKTNATKKYFSVSGTVALAEERDLASSKIFPHLEELNLANEIAFYKEKKEQPAIVKIARPEKIRTEYSSLGEKPGNEIAAKTISAQPEPLPTEKFSAPVIVSASTAPDPEKTEQSTVMTDPIHDPAKKTDRSVVKVDPAIISNTGVEKKEEKKSVAVNSKITEPPVEKEKTVPSPVVRNIPTQDPAAKELTVSVNSKIEDKKTATPTTMPKDAVTETRKTEPEKIPVPDVALVSPAAPFVSTDNLIQKSAVIGGRKSEFSQVVNFKSDSLELALYDNGEIDGDTVSVFMNGEVLMSRQGLKASAIRKTIYIRPGDPEDFTLVMFAENLGKYPPNTGLLVVHDGEDVYHLRFSSDFEKSSGIVFRRKK